MDAKEIESMAEDIVAKLAGEGLTCNEAVKVVMKADSLIRRKRTAMFAKVGSVPLKNVLRGTEKDG